MSTKFHNFKLRIFFNLLNFVVASTFSFYKNSRTLTCCIEYVNIRNIKYKKFFLKYILIVNVGLNLNQLNT